MKVKCPNCAAAYTLAPEKLKPGGVKLRCAKCDTVFLVRTKGDAPSAKPAAPPPPTPPPPADASGDADDLDQFFGGEAPPNTVGAGTGTDDDELFGDSGGDAGDQSDALDAFFGGDGGDDGAANDLFGSDDGDDLFGGGDAGVGDLGDGDPDDLFGDAADLFDEPDAPTASPEPPPPAAGGDEATIDDLFDDTDDAPGDPAPAPDQDAGDESILGFDKNAIPDFDWDDESEREAATMDFSPGLDEEDAERVLRETIVTDLPDGGGPKRRQSRGPLIAVLLLLLIGGLVGGYFVAPQVYAPVLAPIRAAIDDMNKPPPAPAIRIQVSQPPELTIVQNRAGVPLLVASGELVNQDIVPHSFIRVRVALLEGAVAVTKATVYAGNRIGSIQLKNLPVEELQDRLQVEMGDGLSNFNVEPGASVSFMAIFSPAPPGGLDLRAAAKVVESARGQR